MDRRPRLALITLLLVALPAAAAGAPSAAVAVGDDRPGARGAPATSTASAQDSPAPTTVPDDPISDRVDRSTRAAPTARATLPTRLVLESDDVRTSYSRPSSDMSGTIAAGDGEIEAGYVMHYYEYRLERADNDTHRQRIINQALADAERRLERLRRQEAVAIRSYHNGTATRGDLFQELARIDATAETLREGLEALKQHASRGTVVNRINPVQQGLESVEGPIRKRIRDSLAGEDRDVLIHVIASENGLVLETIDDGSYVRSAVRLDHLSPGDGTGNLDVAGSQMTELYPETYPGAPSREFTGTPDPQLFHVEFSHQLGVVETYLDTGTEKRYRELQIVSLIQLPTHSVASSSDNGIQVTVNRTGKGNPILINVTDTRTNDSVEAIIKVDGHRVGETGEDGELWTIGEHGQYTVTVLTFRETVNVTVPASRASVDPTTTTTTTGSDGTESQSTTATEGRLDPTRTVERSARVAPGPILYP